MKILKVYRSQDGFEEFRTGERAVSHPQEFVKDIIYKDGNYSVCFSESYDWFHTFTGFKFEYTEMNEMKTKSNKERLI
jgi:hypothetical protein